MLHRAHAGLSPGRVAARGAFTLVELIVVIAILAAVATLAIPRFANSHNVERLTAALRRVEADLLNARTLATQRSAAHMVEFNEPARSYRVRAGTVASPGPIEYTVDLAAEPYGLTQVVLGSFSSASVVFDGYGRPAVGGKITLRLADLEVEFDLDQDTGLPSAPTWKRN
jgi:prepilin-type N-terminal cleavage/methylation domain-containing protein